MPKLNNADRRRIVRFLEDNGPFPDDVSINPTTGLSCGTKAAKILAKITGEEHKLAVMHFTKDAITFHEDNRNSIPGYLAALNPEVIAEKKDAEDMLAGHSRDDWEQVTKAFLFWASDCRSYDIGTDRTSKPIPIHLKLSVIDNFRDIRTVYVTCAATKAGRAEKNKLLTVADQQDTIVLLWTNELRISTVATTLSDRVRKMKRTWPRPK